MSSISNVFLITDKNELNLSTSWSKKLLIEGRILSSSPSKCSGMTDLSMGSGSVEKTAIVYKVISYIDTEPPPFGSRSWIQLIVLFDYWIINDRFALGCNPNTYGESTLGKCFCMLN